MKQNTIAIVLLVAVVCGAGGFFGGMAYQQSKRGQASTFMTNSQGRMGGPQNGANTKTASRPISGEIIKTDATSITVKSRDSSSKIVLLSETGQIFKAASGSATDLQIGVHVSVFGSPNPDGSVTAQNIQIASIDADITPTPTK